MALLPGAGTGLWQAGRVRLALQAPQPRTTVTQWPGHGTVGARLPGTRSACASPPHRPLCHGRSHGPCSTHVSHSTGRPVRSSCGAGRGRRSPGQTRWGRAGDAAGSGALRGRSGPCAGARPPARTPAAAPRLSPARCRRQTRTHAAGSPRPRARTHQRGPSAAAMPPPAAGAPLAARLRFARERPLPARPPDPSRGTHRSPFTDSHRRYPVPGAAPADQPWHPRTHGRSNTRPETRATRAGTRGCAQRQRRRK